RGDPRRHRHDERRRPLLCVAARRADPSDGLRAHPDDARRIAAYSVVVGFAGWICAAVPMRAYRGSLAVHRSKTGSLETGPSATKGSESLVEQAPVTISGA